MKRYLILIICQIFFFTKLFGQCPTNGNDTICRGGSTILAITVTGASAFSWQVFNAGSFVNISNGVPAGFTYSPSNNDSLTISTSNTTSIAGDYRFRLTFNDNGATCTSPSPEQHLVLRDDPAITGQPSDQTVCLDGTPNNLSVTVTGGTSALTFQWQSSTATCSTAFSDISGQTSSSFLPPTNVIGTIFYRCIITSTDPGCTPTLTSNCATVQVVGDPTITTQPQTSQTLCENGTATNLLVAASGGTGTFSFQWQSSTTSCASGFTNMTGATAASFAPPTGTAGTIFYRCIITQTGAGCNTLTSNCATVVVESAPNITTQPIVTQTVCNGGSPQALTVVVTGGAGTTTFQWQQSSVNCLSGFNNISGATSSTFNPPGTPNGTIFYRCSITQTGSVCATINSECATVIVVAPPSISSQPLATQTVCKDGVPVNLSTSATGGTGTFSFQWQSSNTNCVSNFQNISGATSGTFTPPTNAVGTIFYQCIISQSGTGCGNLTTSCATVEVVADPVISTQPVASQVLCVGDTPANLSVAATGGTGTFSFQWQSSTTNCSSGFTDISGATNSSFTPPTGVAGTIFYHCVITQSGAGCNILTSSCATVVVETAPNITTQPLSTQTVCIGGSPQVLTVVVTGGAGTPTFQWQQSTVDCLTSFTNIPGATNNTFNPPGTAVGTIFYRCLIVQSGSACPSIISNCATVIVVADPTISNQPLASQTVCLDGAPAVLSVTAVGGTGSFTFQWQSSGVSCSGSFTNITGATNNTFTPPTNTVGTTFYKCVISQSGSGCNLSPSNCVSVEVLADPVISAQPIATQTLCENGIPGNLVVAVTGGTGTFTFQWQSSTTSCSSGFTNIGGATLNTFVPPTNVPGTVFYRCNITQSGSGCDALTSNCATVIVVAGPSVTNQPVVSQTLCTGGTPSVLTVTATGGTGVFAFQWQSSSTSCATGFTNISGATNSSFTPPTTATGTIFYQCVVSQSGTGCNVIISNCATVIVVAPPSISTNPISSQTICEGGVPTTLNTSATGGTGTFTFQWQSSSVSCNSGFSNLAGATQNNFTPPTANDGTIFYQCIISQSGPGCGSVTSGCATVHINPFPVLISSNDTTICSQDTVDYKIEFSIANNSFSNVSCNWITSPVTNIIGNISGSGTCLIPDVITNLTTSQSINVPYQLNLTYTDFGLGCSTLENYSVLVNPAPPIPNIAAFSSSGQDNSATFNLCQGTDFVNFIDLNFVDPAITYLWTSTPSAGVSISSPTDSNTVISFPGSGTFTITVQTTSPASGLLCTNEGYNYTINVSANSDTIAELSIIHKDPGDLLIYPDNTIDGYKWGYDSAATRIPSFVNGQVYQVFVPQDRFIINDSLDTGTYHFWVMLHEIFGSDTCITKVYYNGPYAPTRQEPLSQVPDEITAGIYPNPSDGNFELVLSGNIYDNVHLQLINLMGEVVYAGNTAKSEPMQRYPLKLPELAKGLYLLNITGSYGEQVVTKVLIK